MVCFWIGITNNTSNLNFWISKHLSHDLFAWLNCSIYYENSSLRSAVRPCHWFLCPLPSCKRRSKKLYFCYEVFFAGNVSILPIRLKIDQKRIESSIGNGIWFENMEEIRSGRWKNQKACIKKPSIAYETKFVDWMRWPLWKSLRCSECCNVYTECVLHSTQYQTVRKFTHHIHRTHIAWKECKVGSIPSE